MARDLFPEVEKMLSTSNPYIRRKAAICAMRISRKVPDLQEHFIDNAKLLLQDRNHGVLLSGLTLATSMCEADEAEGGEEGIIEVFRPMVGTLVKTLKALSSSGYAPEHDVSGITDPFVQVKILGLLRVLGRGDPATSEQINDILAQVATNTDSSKNVGNSILYEAVLTILDIEADSGLRVLGVNILGKFLANKDNNIRYVALNTLIKVVAVEPNAVQRHRNTILDCLRDPDISIRRRALDLSFTLINASNVSLLIRELLAFLEVADNEFKTTMTSEIGFAADRFAPDKRWHVDTMLRVLKLAGNYVKEPVLSSFIRLVASNSEQQGYSVHKLYAALKEDISQEGLTLAGAWAIGEYGDALLRGGAIDDGTGGAVQESEVVDLFNTILNSAYSSQIVTEYIVTAAMKLTTRFQDQREIERIRRLLSSRTTDLSTEIQQRSVEYSNLFNYDQVRRGVLERMPPPEIRDDQRVLGERSARQKKVAASKKRAPAKPQIQASDLLDLMGSDEPAAGAAQPNGGGGGQNNANLLSDLMGDSGPTAPQQQQGPSSSSQDIMGLFDSSTSGDAPSPAPKQRGGSGLGDLLGGGGGGSPAPSAPATGGGGVPVHTAYSKNDLVLTLQVNRSGGNAQVQARFRNNSNFTRFTGVGLSAAVPKSQKLQLSGISKAELDGGEEATQTMRVSPVSGVSVSFDSKAKG
jgi:AP-1 complex subunit gamma-1